MTVGAVDKVQARVDATQAGQTRALAINSDVYVKDRCHSGEGARLQATSFNQAEVFDCRPWRRCRTICCHISSLG
jgi:hypothetical protein